MNISRTTITHTDLTQYSYVVGDKLIGKSWCHPDNVTFALVSHEGQISRQNIKISKISKSAKFTLSESEYIQARYGQLKTNIICHSYGARKLKDKMIDDIIRYYEQ